MVGVWVGDFGTQSQGSTGGLRILLGGFVFSRSHCRPWRRTVEMGTEMSVGVRMDMDAVEVAVHGAD